MKKIVSIIALSLFAASASFAAVSGAPHCNNQSKAGRFAKTNPDVKLAKTVQTNSTSQTASGTR